MTSADCQTALDAANRQANTDSEEINSLLDDRDPGRVLFLIVKLSQLEDTPKELRDEYEEGLSSIQEEREEWESTRDQRKRLEAEISNLEALHDIEARLAQAEKDLVWEKQENKCYEKALQDEAIIKLNQLKGIIESERNNCQ